MKNTIMKTKAIVIILAIAIFTSTGCTNRQIFDTTYKYNYAIAKLANGEVIEGKVDSWLDFENSDQIQVKINGTTYLVHATNITLMHK